MTDNISELESLKTEIEFLDKEHHITILKILKTDSNIILNENKNGVFVNLTELSKKTLDELKNYCLYVKSQEIKLENLENDQKELENNFFESI